MTRSYRLRGIFIGLMLGWTTAGECASLVTDGGFEQAHLDPGTYRSPVPGATGWVCQGWVWLMHPPVYGLYQAGAAEGNNVMVLRAHGGSYASIEQTVTLPAAGRYRLSYQEAGRMFYPVNLAGGDTEYAVTLGSMILTTNRTASDQMFVARAVEFSAGAGDYLLKFGLLASTAGDQSAIFDAVSLEPIAGAMEIVAQPQDSHVPLGGTATFVVEVANVAPAEVGYQWYFNGAPLAQATANPLVLPNVGMSHAGLYSVRVTHAPSGTSLTSAPAVLEISQIALESYAAVGLEFPTEVGKTYRIEASIDLSDWVGWGDPVAGTGNLVRLFYRANETRGRYFRLRED